MAFSWGPRYSITPGSQGQELCHSTGAKAVLKSRLARRSSSEVVTKSFWFTLREGAVPHTLANIFCKKLHQLGELVEFFSLAAPAFEPENEQELRAYLTPFSIPLGLDPRINIMKDRHDVYKASAN